eukprot:5218386-Lingulodinium_polyedra.AAC.1
MRNTVSASFRMGPSASSARRLAVWTVSRSLSLAGFGPQASPASAVRAAVACAAAMGQRGAPRMPQ